MEKNHIYLYKTFDLDICQIKKGSIAGDEVISVEDQNNNSELLRRWERAVSYGCKSFDSHREEQIYFMQEFLLLDKARMNFYGKLSAKMAVQQDLPELYSTSKEFVEVSGYLISRYQKLATPTIDDPEIDKALRKSYSAYGHFLKGVGQIMQQMSQIIEGNKSNYDVLEFNERVRQNQKELNKAWLGITECMAALGIQPSDIFRETE